MPESHPKGMEDEAFRVWVNGQSSRTRRSARGAVIKRGRDALKTVLVREFDDPTTGELKKRELRLTTHQRRRGQNGFDLDEADPRTAWWCENEEIDRLLTFLNSEVESTGRYRLIDTNSPAATLVDLLRSGQVDSEALAEVMVRHGNATELIKILAATGPGFTAAQVAVANGRLQLLARLRKMIDDPVSTETHVQKLIGNEHWVFGGRYVGVARRNLLSLDQHDISLIEANDSLHIIELKGPNIKTLVRQYRGHLVVGNDVHEAVGQAMNYIRAFDEQGSSTSTTIRDERDEQYDLRRVFATVVIGNPVHNTARWDDGRTISPKQIAQTIRSYNSHLSRVEVVTYQELVDTAERALNFEQSINAPVEPPAAWDRPGC